MKDLWTEGTSWCESFNNGDIPCWPAVRELLEHSHPNVMNQFTKLENVGETKLSDIRLARKAGGFAFEYWCRGGDLKDIESLLSFFKTLIGRDPFPGRIEDDYATVEQRVYTDISSNAVMAAYDTSSDSIWDLSLAEREKLLLQWVNKIGKWPFFLAVQSTRRKDVDSVTIEAQVLNLFARILISRIISRRGDTDFLVPDPITSVDRLAEIHRRHQYAIQRRKRAYEDTDSRVLANRRLI